MCILSLYRKEDEVIFTHNRDEDYRRISSEILNTKEIENVEATYPIDVLSGGTWVLTSDLWTTAILNGANKIHQRKEFYKHSRGLFPFMLLKHNDINSYVESLDLEGIEPFTQIILNNKSKEAWKFQWDEVSKNLEKIEGELFVISSAPLYDLKEKENQFNQIKGLKEFNADNLSHIHRKLIWKEKIELPIIKTTSIVQIQLNKGLKRMKYSKLD